MMKAYLGENNELHRLCAWCEDKEEVEVVVKSLEQKREIKRLMEGFNDYIQKKITHTICQECKEKHFSTES